MTFFSTTLSPIDVKTRELFNAALERKNAPIRMMIAKVFVQDSYHSLPAEQIAGSICQAEGLFDIPSTNEAIQAELTTLCREKVLRSRRHSGKTLYEVNY